MKTPRVQSLLAALALLAASRVAASAAAVTEPKSIRWRPVVFHSSNGKNAMPCGVAYCKASHCAKAPVGPTHVPLYCRGKNGAMENSSYVMTLTPSGSSFRLTSNKEKGGPTGISVKFGDQWATAPDPDKPTQHVETSRPRKKPVGKKPRRTKPDETKPGETKPDETKPDVTKPDVAKPEAVQDLKPLTDDEVKNLNPDDRKAYQLRLKDLQKKLKDAQAAELLALNEELSALITEYRKKAADSALTSIPVNVADLESLSSPKQLKFCKELLSADDGYIAGYKVVTGAKDQLTTAAVTDEKARGIMTGQADRGTPAVSASAPPQIEQTEVAKIRSRCKELLAALPASSGGPQGNIAGNVPAPPTTKAKEDCEKKDKDGKCVEEKKDDPNKWLSVKTGAVGMLPGVMVGSFFGPVGIVVGAAVGFALFWGLSKLS